MSHVVSPEFSRAEGKRSTLSLQWTAQLNWNMLTSPGKYFENPKFLKVLILIDCLVLSKTKAALDVADQG